MSPDRKDAAVPAVGVRNLRQVYIRKGHPPRVALEGLTLTIPKGEIHGFLGPNGAGKTTLCKILSTILIPTAGSAHILGFDVVAQSKAVRPLVGVVFGGERGLYTRLTARQNLLYWSALYGQRRAVGRVAVDSLLDRVGLAERADERVESFSRGMKQRLHLARGMIGDPKLLILDEPTTGMDPVSALDFRSMIADLRNEGRSILLTTHDMREAEAVCDRVSLIDQGRLLATEDPRAIGSWLAIYGRVTAENVSIETESIMRDLPGVLSVSRDGDSVLIEVGAEGAMRDVLRFLVADGITCLATGQPSLEEFYLAKIGNRGLAVR